MNIHAHPTKKIGVLPRPAHVKTCKLANYLNIGMIPTPPASYDWGTTAPNSLQMFMNDSIGDCAVAAYLHHKETVLQTAGLGVSFLDPVALEVYEWATADENGGQGYNPKAGSGDNNPTDTGLVLVSFLEDLRTRGLIYAHAEVNLNNAKEVAAAQYLFGGLYVGVALPVFVQNLQNLWYIPTTAQNLGDPTKGSWGGHCIYTRGITPTTGNTILTSWGETIQATPQWMQTYQDEAHIIVHKHSAAAFDKLASANFGINDLIADLNEIKK